MKSRKMSVFLATVMIFTLLILLFVALINILISTRAQQAALETQRIEELMLQPASAVEFINFVSPFAGTTVPAFPDVGAEINIMVLNEKQQEREKFLNHLISHYELEIDGQVLPRSLIRFRVSGVSNSPLANGILMAYSKTTLSDGLHLATVRLSSLEGKLYSYTWAFRVNSQTSEIEATRQAIKTDPYVQREATISARYFTPTPTQ